MEFITCGDWRRVWAAERRRAIALESLDLGTTLTDVARRYGISSGLLYTWRRLLREGQLGSAPRQAPKFARVALIGAARLTAPEPAQPIADPPPPALPPQSLPAQTLPPAGLIEIALPGGASVRVDGSVDGAALRRVLDILEGR